MHSEKLISHPEFQPLIRKLKREFSGIPSELYMLDLRWHGYTGMGLSLNKVKSILNKYLSQ